MRSKKYKLSVLSSTFIATKLLCCPPDEELVIPPATCVVVAPHALHNLPQYFSNTEKFDPDRFLPDQVLYIPFSAG